MELQEGRWEAENCSYWALSPFNREWGKSNTRCYALKSKTMKQLVLERRHQEGSEDNDHNDDDDDPNWVDTLDLEYTNN